MRAVVQRVKKAKVEVEGKEVGAIGPGILVLIGVHKTDTFEQIPWLAKRVTELRMFRDAEEKMNLSVQDIGGEILVVSQFTLYGDCSKGRRPGFSEAQGGEEAKELYLAFVAEIMKLMGRVETGIFAADMAVSLVNDGPVTFVIDSKP